MNCRMVAAAVLLVVVMGCMRVSEGQELPACATNVVPCMDFLNLTTKPPASCCDPLSRAVVKQLSCLCNLYTTPSFFESYSINFTLAIRLPSLCGISTDLTTCLGGGKNGTTSPIPASLGNTTILITFSFFLSFHTTFTPLFMGRTISPTFFSLFSTNLLIYLYI
ncbi:hypothetical protein DCAR_0831650 [Daucus carota subsp. sativus]|uniref:Bifunctional inhibitor/plant lipid transfer protein/seed storage helical domain-containing protein n=1 Tax=Daucus carota subsp. sativus TaxID=79200 RepID=A0AAF0XTJ8_DAUCS|nr:hypothetical protein DCAR_0831650 [Daucus carota subsp. sativus]